MCGKSGEVFFLIHARVCENLNGNSRLLRENSWLFYDYGEIRNLNKDRRLAWPEQIDELEYGKLIDFEIWDGGRKHLLS